jgi:hypothetical protein
LGDRDAAFDWLEKAYQERFPCFAIWGYMALIIGLLLAGVGVWPVALIAALFHGEWSVVLELLVGLVLAFGTRFLGTTLMEAAETTTA